MTIAAEAKRKTGKDTIADLRRPYPRITIRAIAIGAMTLAVLYWGIIGTDARPSTLAEGVPNMIDFVSRLLPPEFEFEPDSERAYNLFPPSVSIPVQVTNSDRLNEAPMASEEDLDAIEDNQRIEYLYRGENRRFAYTADAIEDEGEIEEIAYILASDEYLYIDPEPSDVYILPEGTYFDNRFAVEEGKLLVARRYLINEGEIFVGVPLLIASIVETVQMALIGTLGAIILSLPLGLFAARNVSPHPAIYQITRLLLNINRSIPELVYALIMVAAVGLGPFPGVLALVIGSLGSMGKLYAESIEAIDPQQVAAVRATGAPPLQVFNYAVIPQAFPMIASYSLLLFEGNVRAATILGIVGAGGVGLLIQKYIALFQYQRLMGAIIIIAVVVTVIDRISDYIRKRII